MVYSVKTKGLFCIKRNWYWTRWWWKWKKCTSHGKRRPRTKTRSFLYFFLRKKAKTEKQWISKSNLLEKNSNKNNKMFLIYFVIFRVFFFVQRVFRSVYKPSIKYEFSNSFCICFDVEQRDATKIRSAACLLNGALFLPLLRERAQNISFTKSRRQWRSQKTTRRYVDGKPDIVTIFIYTIGRVLFDFSICHLCAAVYTIKGKKTNSITI